MLVNSIKTKNNFHNYIVIKQSDNTSPIEILLCGANGSILSDLNQSCTLTILDEVDGLIRQKTKEQIVNGTVTFRVANDLKTNPHTLEITTADGQKFPSNHDFKIFVSYTHDESELRVINNLSREEALAEIDQSVKSFISNNTEDFIDKVATSKWLYENNFKPKEPVAKFNDLPNDAELKELRGVTDENAVYVFDGTKWVKQSQLNFDGLSEVKKEVAQTEKVVFPENYGAKGDGVTDDYEAFRLAINSFPTASSIKIVLQDKKYKINKPLINSRRLSFVGRGIDKTVLDFSDVELLPAPYNANIISVHSNNINVPTGVPLPSGNVGTDAKNSIFLDLSVKGGKSKSKKDIGILVNTPLELSRLRVYDCGSHGYQLIGNVEVNGVKVGGNCNHTKIRQCSAFGNGGDGFNISGADANTFVLDLVTTYYNDGWGIYDDSFLGGVVIGAESDGNKLGSFASASASKRASRTVWLGTYSESNQPIHYNLSSRHLILGATGSLPESGQNYFGGMVDRGFYSAKPIIVADTEQQGYELNGVNGQVSRLSKNKLEIYTTLGKLPIKLEQDGLSDKYAALRIGTIRSILFPFENLTDALQAGRPYFSTGYAIDQYISYQAGGAPPSTGTYTKGQRVVNTNPVPGGYEGWVCVTSGSPGTWKGYGKIEL